MNYNYPMVMGTRCQQLAMYVVYESPLMMVSDSPEAYRGAVGTDFIRQVPTSWDETRVLAGDVAEYVVIARRLRQGLVYRRHDQLDAAPPDHFSRRPGKW